MSEIFKIGPQACQNQIDALETQLAFWVDRCKHHRHPDVSASTSQDERDRALGNLRGVWASINHYKRRVKYLDEHPWERWDSWEGYANDRDE
jgi:hypothetical protein